MDTALVARRAEIDYLNVCLDGLNSAQAFGVLVGGEAGIGKTKLIRHFAAIASERGFLISASYLDDQAPQGPYEMWRQAIRAWIIDAERVGRHDVIRTLMDEPWQALAGLAPDLFARHGWRARRSADRRSDPRIDSIERLLGEEIMLFITQATACVPSVLLVDNLHAADLDSLALLAEVSPEVEAMPGMFVATFRPEIVRDDEQLSALLRTLQGPGDMHILELGPFTSDGVLEYLREIGAEVDERSVAATYAITGGHPLLLSELTATIEHESVTDALRRFESESPPETVQRRLSTIIERRLARLDTEHRIILGPAALLEAGFSVAELASCAAVPVTIAREALEGAKELGLTVENTPGDRFSFRHPLLRETIACRVAPGEARAVHRRAAEYLMTVVSLDDVATLERLVHHCFAAHEPRFRRHGVRFLLAAGREAMRKGAWRRSEQIFREVAGTHRELLRPGELVETEIAIAIALLYHGRKPAAYHRLVGAFSKILSGVHVGDSLELILRPEISEMWGGEYEHILHSILSRITDSHWLSERTPVADRPVAPARDDLLRRIEHQARAAGMTSIAHESATLLQHVCGAYGHTDSTPAETSFESRANGPRRTMIRAELNARHALRVAQEAIFSGPDTADRARAAGLKALHLAEKARNPFLVAEAYHTLFRIASRQLRTGEARRLCDSGLNSYPVHDLLLHGRVQLEAVNGNLRAAKSYLRRLKENTDEKSDGPVVSRVALGGAYHTIGLLYADQREYLETGQTILDSAVRSRSIPEAIMNFARVTWNMGAVYMGEITDLDGASVLADSAEASLMAAPGHIHRLRTLTAAAGGSVAQVIELTARARHWFRRTHDIAGEVYALIEAAELLCASPRICGNRLPVDGESREHGRRLLEEAASIVEQHDLPPLRTLLESARLCADGTNRIDRRSPDKREGGSATGPERS